MDTDETSSSQNSSVRGRGMNKSLTQAARTRRRSVRGRRSVINLSSDQASSSSTGKISLTEHLNSDERKMERINNLKAEVEDTMAYRKNLERQMEAWDKLKVEKEDLFLRASQMVGEPHVLDTKKTTRVTNRYVRSIIQGMPAAEVARTIVEKCLNQDSLKVMDAKSEEEQKLEKEAARVRLALEAQQKFFNTLREIDFQGAISQLNKIIEDEQRCDLKEGLAAKLVLSWPEEENMDIKTS